jgi:TatA/E family protein of Tat protein translocase
MSIGFTEILLIAAVAALLFGGRRIAQLGSELGKSAGDLKRGLEKRVEEREQAEANGERPAKPVLVEVVEAAREVKDVADRARKFPFN